MHICKAAQRGDPLLIILLIFHCASPISISLWGRQTDSLTSQDGYNSQRLRWAPAVLKILVYLKETVPDAGSQKWRVCQGFLTQPTWHWSFYDAQNCLQIRMSVCGCMPVTTNKVHPSSWICVCVCASGGFGPSVTDPASWPQSSLNTCYHSGNSEPKRTRNLTIKWSNSVKSRIAKSVALLSQQTLS